MKRLLLISLLVPVAAVAQQVGDYVTASLPSGSAVSLTSDRAATVVSAPITAGDWDVSCNIVFTANATTAVNVYTMSPSSTTNALPGLPAEGLSLIQYNSGIGPGTTTSLSGGPARFKVAGNSTVYCVAHAIYGGGGSAVSAYGIIRARRAR
jgi:hypothetical protein